MAEKVTPTCNILNDVIPTSVELSLKFDYISDRALDGQLRDKNQTSKASLWWGQSLM